MEIVSSSVYVGPNIYSRQPLVRLTVDLRRRADRPVSDYADDLIGPLLKDFPNLATAVCEQGMPLIERMRADPDCRLGEVLAHVALALQQRAGAAVEEAITRPASHPDEVEVLYGYESRDVGLEAGDVARDIIMELIAPIPEDPLDIEDEIAAFMDFASRRALGPSALALVQAAEARGIPGCGSTRPA